MTSVRLAVIGDSFAEGVGDELGDGSVRGWGDRLAQGWANATGSEVAYVNTAIRGKLVWEIVDEQLERVLAKGPTHLAFNGGGNDLIRPKVDIQHVADAYTRVINRCIEEGVQPIILSGANPSDQLPFGKVTQRRGDELSVAVGDILRRHPEVTAALNWPDTELRQPAYWAPDRLHLNEYGHRRVAARVLHSLGVAADESWWIAPVTAEPGPTGFRYFHTYFVPWLGRRVRGKSSGDGRPPKYGDWVSRYPEE